QAAHRSPLPTHPKASITPHPGGLLRKAGRSPSDRPFVFLAGDHPQKAADDRLESPEKLNKNLALRRRRRRMLPCECSLRYPKSAYLRKRNVTKSVSESAEICILASYRGKRPC